MSVYTGPGLIATVGTFDGVHIGHRHLLSELKGHAARLGLRPVAIVLDTHPLQVVRPQSAPPQLSAFAERKALIEAEGVEVMRLGFTSRSRTETSAGFMRRISDEMGIKALLVGHDNRFGSDREHGLAHYRAVGAEIGMEVIEATCLQGVSSSEVRRALMAGDIRRGTRLLGRYYSLGGTVVGGARLGRTIGFPTANLTPASQESLIPPAGVYATLVSADCMQDPRPAMTNIGHRPTVAAQDSPLTIETHIPGFSGDLYGQAIRLHFVARLRDERRFSSLEELAGQLRRDAADALAAIRQDKNT